MSRHTYRRFRYLALLLLLARPGSVSAESAEWNVTRGEIRIVCPLTVGGSFEGRSLGVTGALHLRAASPATASFEGDVRLDLRTIDTGIELRNRHLRENYLEVAKGQAFETAILSDLVLPGTDPARPDGKARFTAQLLVHGVKKSISGTADIGILANTARVEARFPLRLGDYDIPPPRYLGVGVSDQIEIIVSLVLETKEAQE